MTAFAIGATGAGALAGAIAGGLGALVLGGSGGWRSRLAVLAAALLAALALDLLRAVPSPRRQVNERWLDAFRGWVYGLGFGVQLGVAVTTVVSSAATYVALLAAFLTGDVVWGALVLGCFGAVRGLTPLAAVWVRRPEQLVAMHAALERWRAPAGRLGPTLLAGICVLAGVGSVA